MAEPTGSQMPTAFDDADSLLGGLLDHRSFRLQSAIVASDTTIMTTGSLSDIELPVYLTFDDQVDIQDAEIIYCDEINGTGDGFVNVSRGVRGTVAQSHSSNATFYMAYTGKHATLLHLAILAAQKYQGLVGNDSAKGTAVEGYIYTATDTDRVYWGRKLTGQSAYWQPLGQTDHGQMEKLTEGDHTIYHNDARALTWHDGLTGAHVEDGDNHTHIHGTGCGRIRATTYTGMPSPTAAREVCYDLTNNELYVANTTPAWVKVTGAPQDAIVPFRDLTPHSLACPSTWTRFSGLDERIPIGCETGKVVSDYSPVTLGSDTHTHAYSYSKSHRHNVPQFDSSLAAIGNHGHGYGLFNGSPGQGMHTVTSRNYTQYSMSTCDDHYHDVTMSADQTDATKRTSDSADAVAEGTSVSGSSLPPYYTVVWCEKD